MQVCRTLKPQAACLRVCLARAVRDRVSNRSSTGEQHRSKVCSADEIKAAEIRCININMCFNTWGAVLDGWTLVLYKKDNYDLRRNGVK